MLRWYRNQIQEVMAQEKKQDTVVQPLATENGSAQAQGPQTPQPRPCPQDCRKCGTSQQVFCSTKMLFDMSRAMQEGMQRLAEVEKAMADLQAKMKQEQVSELSIPFSE